MTYHAISKIRQVLFLLLSCTLLVRSDVVATPPPASPLEASLAPFSDLRPESPSPRHHQRAEILFRLGRFPEAVANYGVAAESGDDEAEGRGRRLFYAHYYVGKRPHRAYG